MCFNEITIVKESATTIPINIHTFFLNAFLMPKDFFVALSFILFFHLCINYCNNLIIFRFQLAFNKTIITF